VFRCILRVGRMMLVLRVVLVIVLVGLLGLGETDLDVR
jgi:hypothetical protein